MCIDGHNSSRLTDEDCIKPCLTKSNPELNAYRRLLGLLLMYSVVICVKSTTEIGRVTNGKKTQPQLGSELSSRNFVIAGHE